MGRGKSRVTPAPGNGGNGTRGTGKSGDGKKEGETPLTPAQAKRESRKSLFLTEYALHGNATGACEKAGIPRQTYERWFSNDERFRAKCLNVREKIVDMVEGSLLREAKAGNITAQIFFLKTQGKHRGYVERQEVTGPGGNAISIEQIRQRNEAADRILSDPEARRLANELLGIVSRRPPTDSNDESRGVSVVRH